MSQKIIRVGSSAAVTIPKSYMSKLGFKVGDRVHISASRSSRALQINPEKTVSTRERHVALLTASFIERYRKDLEALAHK